MKWLTEAWKVVRHFIAPLVAYLKGRSDEKLKGENLSYKTFLEESNKRYERRKSIRAKYDRVRDNVVRLRKKGDIPKSEE